ncbi:N-formylglutamate amidohydrolase [Erythrobacteraceae bacterium E2-1 Yellow Sea]|nr:N-formylglutamate amidohydrolase [Erythrobacteraceae bacterium E2-1 Yellow Sea]
MTVNAENGNDSRLMTGGAIPGGRGPAFTLQSPHEPSIPVIIAVPHAGRAYPSSVLAQMRSADYASMRLEDRFVDEVARQVALQTGAILLVAQAPRAMIDLNRAPDDVDWDMVSGVQGNFVRHSQANRRARSGLGIIPRRLPAHGEIWRGQTSVRELEARLEGIHRPYHQALAQEMEALRDIWGAALLLDIHSMPPLKRRFGQDQAPQFVLGDRFGTSCDDMLSARALHYLDNKHCHNAHNRPYSGGYVLERHSAPRRGLHAMQMEICRTTYLDHSLAETGPGLPNIANMLAGLVRELADVTIRLGQGSSYSLAAE